MGEALQDHLICGLKSMQIQKKLLAERDLTFKKAFETAQSMELANKEDFRDTSVPVDNTIKGRQICQSRAFNWRPRELFFVVVEGILH